MSGLLGAIIAASVSRGSQRKRSPACSCCFCHSPSATATRGGFTRTKPAVSGQPNVRKQLMSRSERLLDLMQVLRRHRRPVSGQSLAEELGISIRTLYRDIATLQHQGVPIDGEAGLGYVLSGGFFLPPLMFDGDEVDAVILGLRFVMRRGDAALARAAENVLAKIEAVLPPEMADAAASSGLMAGPGGSGEPPTPHGNPRCDSAGREAASRLFRQDGQGHELSCLADRRGIFRERGNARGLVRGAR